MMKHLLSFAAALLPCMALAADFYITPEGNGNKDGSTWSNAMGLTEYYAHMKFVFNSTPVNEAHQGEQYYFSTGTYVFNQTVFVYRSGVSFKGGYDEATGQPALSGRTVFDGNGKERNNGALFIYNNTEINSDNVNDRAVTIEGIDFENFITKGTWRGNETNWQYGRPAAIYVKFCGRFEMNDCNFRNNVCTGTGDNAMAGALSLNKVNALISDCSFIGNAGTDGGAIKMYYDESGTWSKMSQLVLDRCYFSGNKSSNRGGAVYARNAQALNVINSTMVGNEAPEGGAIFLNENNAASAYPNAGNIISSTIAGNTSDAGEQIFTMTTALLKVGNSIVASDGDAFAISGADASGYQFLGNNLIGKVAEGYEASSTDNVSAENNYQAVFGTNQLAANGTLTPIKFLNSMAVDDIKSIVAAQGWSYSVDCAVDQLGNERSTQKSNGALAISTSGIEAVAIDNNADENWYDLRGIKINGAPKKGGLYIHNGKKVVVW